MDTAKASNLNEQWKTLEEKNCLYTLYLKSYSKYNLYCIYFLISYFRHLSFVDDECSETVLCIKQGKVLVKSQPKLKINIELKKSTKLCFMYTSKKIFFYSFYLISVALIIIHGWDRSWYIFRVFEN